MRTFRAKRYKKKLPGKTRKQTRHIQAEAYDKKKLKRSGLWDERAARKSTLVITKVEKP